MKTENNKAGIKWYIYTVNEVWIVEKLTDIAYGDFEIRKYKSDGSVYREYLDWFDGVSYINLNQMKKMELINNKKGETSL